MRKIEGVESAKVSLNEGLARIRLKPGNKVRLEQIRKTINEQGFTPKDAKVTAVGDLMATDKRLEFKVSGSGETFAVLETPHAPWKGRAGENVIVSGIIAASPKGRESESGTIQVNEVKRQNGK